MKNLLLETSAARHLGMGIRTKRRGQKGARLKSARQKSARQKRAETKGRETFSKSKRLAYTVIKNLTRDLNQAMES